MTGIRLRVAEPTGRYRRTLRRWRFTGSAGPPCPAAGDRSYCDASNPIGEISEAEADAAGDTWPHDDPRWPAACAACGYQFGPDDHWQRNDARLYRLPDGTEFALWGDAGKAAPPGTMIRTPWYDDMPGAAGEAWMVTLPDGGTWITTQSASGGGTWTVTGTPPAITVTPSIWHNQPHGWHGFIRDGQFADA